MRVKRALYAFSGDPITFGHLDIIQRAAHVFDEVTVGIGVNPDKRYLYTLEERQEMARRAVSRLENVKVVSFEGLLVDYAWENKISVIIKGVRNSADFDYENNLHQIGESQKLGIDTHILFARPELAHVSSSNAKAIQKEQGFIHEYVPLNVKQSLEAKLSGQYIVGLTGEIGAGKSYVGARFEEWGRQNGVEVHNLDLDRLGHDIYERPEPVYVEMRQKLGELFGKQVLTDKGHVNRKKLGEIVFGRPEALGQLNALLATPLLVRLRRELSRKTGLILLNAALIAEAAMGYLVNNNVILVRADKAVQRTRLAERQLTEEQMERRLASQFSHDEKRAQLEARIARDNWGRVWELDNSQPGNTAALEALFADVVQALGVPRRS